VSPAERDDIFVGLMSGTSLDGASAAIVRIASGAHGATHTVDLLGFLTRPYTTAERERLERAIHEGATTAEWCRLDFDVGGWLAEAALAVIAEAGVPRAYIRAVASHGQTVWHEPPRATWQIGEAAVIAERTGLDVVSDFRVRDVAAGGQGAPLVPIADASLFSAPDAWRALQNLGGIGNVTIVPPGGALEGVRAFDTGPGVVIIDGVVRTLRPNLRYDADGELARAGTPIREVVDRLLADPYFAAAPPKSTGREHFTAHYVAGLIAACRAARADATDADIVATAVSLTARSIADAYQRFVPEPVLDVLLSGGGTRNRTLRDWLSADLAPRRVRAFEELYFDGDAKEAVAFAFLAYLHFRGMTGNLPTATGARGRRILGKLTPR